jgi:hypothetical protein
VIAPVAGVGFVDERVDDRRADAIGTEAVMRQLQQPPRDERIGGRYHLGDVLRRFVDQIFLDPLTPLDQRHRAVGDDADDAGGVVADDHAVDPHRVRRVILIGVHPLVQQQQPRRLVPHHDHEAVDPVGHAAEHLNRHLANVDQPAEAREVRHLTRDDGAVGTDVLLVDERIEAAGQLRGDFLLQPARVALADRPATLQLGPGERLGRFDVVRHVRFSGSRRRPAWRSGR